MTDERKRKIIRSLQSLDRASSTANKRESPSVNELPDVMYENKAEQKAFHDRLEEMSGTELSAELRRQILFTVVPAVLILVVIGLLLYFKVFKNT